MKNSTKKYTRDFNKRWLFVGIKSRKNPESRGFYINPWDKNPEIKKNPESRVFFSGFSNPYPDPRDFGIFEIFHWGFFRDCQIPIPGISRFSGFFDLAKIKNPDSESRGSEFGIRNPGKIPSRSQPWISIV